MMAELIGNLHLRESRFQTRLFQTLQNYFVFIGVDGFVHPLSLYPKSGYPKMGYYDILGLPAKGPVGNPPSRGPRNEIGRDGY